MSFTKFRKNGKLVHLVNKNYILKLCMSDNLQLWHGVHHVKMWEFCKQFV